MFRKSARQLHQMYKEGEISAVEIAENLLSRIESFDSQVGAFLTVLSPRLLQKARDLDHKRATGKPLGLLAGIPIAVKDNMHMSKEITTCGSKFLSNYKAPFDATVV